MKKPSLVIRADAPGDDTVGTGHVMRCIAIGEEWISRGGKVGLISSAKCVPWVADAVEAAGIDDAYMGGIEPGSSDDAGGLISYANMLQADWVVVDGYSFSYGYQMDLRGMMFKTMVLDDEVNRARYAADIVLNQDMDDAVVYADKMQLGHTKILMGPTYSLIRRGFQAYRRALRVYSGTATKVFIGMGGEDPLGVTAKIEGALREVHGLIITKPDGKTPVPALMHEADIGIVNGGTMAMEALCVGLPSIVIPLSDNQQAPAARYQEVAAAWSVCQVDKISSELLHSFEHLAACHKCRRGTSKNAMRFIDGEGSHRVVDEMIGAKNAS